MDARLVTAAHRVLLALNRAGVCYALCGGMAVAAHGIGRATDDIDILLASEDLAAASAALAADGWLTTSEAITFPDGITLHRRLLFEGKGHHILDLLIPQAGSGWLDQRERSDFAGAIAYVLGRPALIAMKRLAGRPQDLADIARLEELGDGRT